MIGVIYPGDPEKCLRQVFINHFINGKPLNYNYSQDWKGLMELERIMPGGRERGGGGGDHVQTCEKVRKHIGNGCTSLIPNYFMLLGMHTLYI